MTGPCLLVGIDTEGDNQWDVHAREAQTFDNVHALPQLHTRFERHGVRPTYVVTYPVATDPKSIEIVRYLQLRGTCEIGAHHHAWETPPCDEEDARRHAYASMLPHERFEQQLRTLTSAIEHAAGERPVTYRSGRFGLAANHVCSLEREGYLVESSVVPLFYEARRGGPDFVEAPLRPYFLAYDSTVRPGSSNVLEVPCSAALSRRVPDRLAWAYARAPWQYQTRRVLRKLGIARVRWLRPSYSSLDDMKALARQLVASGEAVLNVMFHSSEAIVGGSPYNRTAGELEAFFDRLEQFLAFATGELGATPVTYREFRDRFLRH